MAKQIEVRFETITPQLAKDLLSGNLHNRSVSKNRVHYYAEIMKRGEWDGRNGESIKITRDGEITDGQHRLLAVIESGIPTEMMVVYNVSLQSQETIDQGRPRSLTDIFTLRGYKNAKYLSSISKALVRWEKNSPQDAFRFGIMGANMPTNGECLAFVSIHNDQLQEAISKGRIVGTAIKQSITVFGILYYKLAEIEPDEADSFFSHLATGEGLTDKDPIFMLRKVMLKIALNPNIKPPAVWVAAITIKAWNAWTTGNEIRLLRFKTHGDNTESFPQILKPIESLMNE